MSNLQSQDSYQVYCQGYLSEDKVRVLMELYQPISSYQAISLYLTLYHEIERQKMLNIESTHYRLVSMMQMTIEDLQIAREYLEGLGLLKTYINCSESRQLYVYELMMPLTPDAFFNHSLYNVLLYRSLGEMDYEKTRYFFAIPSIDKNEYEEVTVNFNEVFHIDLDSPLGLGVLKRKGTFENDECQEPILSYDLNSFYEGLANYQIRRSAITKSIEQLICQLGTVYHISPLAMRDLVFDVYRDGIINEEDLKIRCERYYSFENESKVKKAFEKTETTARKTTLTRKEKKIAQLDSLSPYEYLCALQQGAKPTARDLGMIEKCLTEQKFSSGVCNVLIETVIRLNNGALPRNHFESLAGLFARKHVKSTTDALTIASEYMRERMANKQETSKVARSATKKTVRYDDQDYEKLQQRMNSILQTK